MGNKIILADREDYRSIESEEQMNFVLGILHNLGIPDEEIDACLTSDYFSVQDKINLRKLCNKFSITIVDNSDGQIKIYVKTDNQENLVAEWKKSFFKMKVDSTSLNKSKFYIEIHINWWTIFEENISEENNEGR